MDNTVTVAVETPFTVVDEPTVQRAVVDDENVTVPPEVVLAETVNV